MQKKFLSSIIFLSFSVSALAQTGFQRSYAIDSLSNEVTDVIPTKDGGYILAGRALDSIYDDMMLIKTASDGSVTWANTYGTTAIDYGVKVKQTADGGYILMGNTYFFPATYKDVVLLKTNANGVQQWAKYYGGSQYDEGDDLLLDSDGGFVVTGNTASYGVAHPSAYTFKTDSTGNILWNNICTFDSNAALYSIKRLTSGGYIAAGTTINGADFEVYLQKINTAGQTVWAKTVNAPGISQAFSISEYKNGFVITGSTNSGSSGVTGILAMRTDTGGNVLWAHEIENLNYDYGEGISVDSINNIFITGYITPSLSTANNIFLLKLDSNGAFLDTSDLNTSSFNSIGSAINISGNTVLIAGNTYPNDSLFNSLFVKTDLSGNACSSSLLNLNVDTLSFSNSSGGTTINQDSSGIISLTQTIVPLISNIICEPEGIRNVNAPSFNIYPNPTTGMATIQLSPAVHQIEVINLEGKVMLQMEGANENEVLNISSLNAGMYFVRIKQGGGVMTEKLIKL